MASLSGIDFELWALDTPFHDYTLARLRKDFNQVSRRQLYRYNREYLDGVGHALCLRWCEPIIERRRAVERRYYRMRVRIHAKQMNRYSQSQRDCVLQPRVARNELPWGAAQQVSSTPKWVVPFCRTLKPSARQHWVTDTTRFGVDVKSTSVTQGSSFLATMGFAAESLWDSQTAPAPTSGGATTNIFDDENRLVWVSTEAGLAEQIATEFVYDGLGRLREQLLWTNNAGTGGQSPQLPTNGWGLIGGIAYVYDGNRVIQERDLNNNPLVAYTRGNDLSGTLEGAGGIGGLLARSDGYSAGMFSDHNFYHADGNGNITYLVNSSQTLAASYRYDPFGNLISSSGTLAPTNTYRFSSKEFIPSVGIYYYLYRFYEPGLQRWMNRDPIGERASIMLYGFVANAPVNAIDSAGLQTMVVEPDYPIQPGRPLWVKDPWDNSDINKELNHLEPLDPMEPPDIPWPCPYHCPAGQCPLHLSAAPTPPEKPTPPITLPPTPQPWLGNGCSVCPVNTAPILPTVIIYQPPPPLYPG
jgi:RHS repeat-associated protein